MIGLRILLLLLAAREANDIVQFVYNVSEIFVAPFRGILRIDEIQAGVSALDFGAVVALVGWLIIELIVIAVRACPDRPRSPDPCAEPAGCDNRRPRWRAPVDRDRSVDQPAGIPPAAR